MLKWKISVIRFRDSTENTDALQKVKSFVDTLTANKITSCSPINFPIEQSPCASNDFLISQNKKTHVLESIRNILSDQIKTSVLCF